MILFLSLLSSLSKNKTSLGENFFFKGNYTEVQILRL